ASIAAFSGLAVTRRSLSVVVAMVVWIVGSSVAGIVPLLAAARPPAGTGPRSLPSWLPAVARGLLLAIPLVLVLTVHFASAHPIFRLRMDDLLGIRADLGDLPGRMLFIIGLTWLIAGLLAVAALGIPALEGASLGAAVPNAALVASRFLGTTEALVIL